MLRPLMNELFNWVDCKHHVLNLVILSIGVFVLIFKLWRNTSRVNGKIPGNLGLPLLGESFSFLSATNSTRGCYDFVRLRRIKYGKWFKTRIFGKTHVFVPSPEGAKAIFSSDFVEFNKGYIKSMGDAVGKRSLLTVPHDSHRRIRRVLSEPFSMNSMSNYVQKIDILVSQRLKKLEEKGESFRLLNFTMKVNFESICQMLMSISNTHLLDQMEKYCNDISNAMLCIPLMIPGTSYYRGQKARGKLMNMFKEMIARRREGKDNFDDFLQRMLERSSLSDDEKLTDEEIMDNLLTLIIAGQNTTAAAMMWSVKFLDDNKIAQQTLRAEQLSIAKNMAKGEALTLQNVQAMSYGSKVVKETLRMSNVLLWFPRVSLNDCVVDGYEVKKGWHVNVDATCIHYDPSIYKDSMKFNPSRFDEAQKAFTYMPFGLGPRTCLGMNMAKVTMLVFLHRLTTGFRWRVEDDDLSLEKKAHIPRLRSGYPITLIPLNELNVDG